MLTIEKRTEIEQRLTNKPAEGIPDVLDPASFISSRLTEVNSLLEAMKESRKASSKRVFQTLPKYLRRRAASHCPKRVPKNYRQAARCEASILTSAKKRKKETKQEGKKMSTGVKTRKVISRASQRKKKKTLLESRLYPFGGKGASFPPDAKVLSSDANREFQGSTLSSLTNPKPFWLPSHYWYAKRFAMGTLWNYQLAIQSNLKIYRPSVRAAGVSGCTLYDSSYENCLLLQSTEIAISDETCLILYLNANSSYKWKSPSPFTLYFYSIEDKLLGAVCVEFLPMMNPHQALLWIHPMIFDLVQKSLSMPFIDLSGYFCKFELLGPDAINSLASLFKCTIEPSNATSIFVCQSSYDSNKKDAADIKSEFSQDSNADSFYLDNCDARFKIRVVVQLPQYLFLVLPRSRFPQIWKKLVYSNKFIVIGLSEKRTIIEQLCYSRTTISFGYQQVQQVDLSHLARLPDHLFFPFYLPGTKFFSDLLFEDFTTYFSSPDLRRPSGKRIIQISPCDLFSQLLSGNTLDLSISPLIMSGRGRPGFGSTIYTYSGAISESNLVLSLPLPIDCVVKDSDNSFPAPINSSLCYDRPVTFDSFDQDRLNVIGFTIVNPINIRRKASNGFSILSGSGYGLAIYGRNLISSCIHTVWIRNLTSPSILYPAKLISCP